MPWSLVQIQDAPPIYKKMNQGSIGTVFLLALPDKPKEFKAAFEKKTQIENFIFFIAHLPLSFSRLGGRLCATH